MFDANNPDDLRARAAHYDQLAADMIDDQAFWVLYELAQHYRARADELVAQSAILSGPAHSAHQHPL